MDIQYIHLEAVRTSLQVITTVQRFQDKDWMKWNRPAGLSTTDPKRNVQGGWKTPACREIEAELCKPVVLGKLRSMVKPAQNLASARCNEDNMRKRRQQREWFQDYRNRDYVQSKLDETVFNAFVGEEFTLTCMTTGCLDALDSLPAGSLQVTVEPYYDQRMVCRGKTQAEIDDLMALATRLIDDIKP